VADGGVSGNELATNGNGRQRRRSRGKKGFAASDQTKNRAERKREKKKMSESSSLLEGNVFHAKGEGTKKGITQIKQESRCLVKKKGGRRKHGIHAIRGRYVESHFVIKQGPGTVTKSPSRRVIWESPGVTRRRGNTRNTPSV